MSLGTGELNIQIRYEDAKRWGTLHWARPLIDIAYDGSSDTVDGQMRQLMPVVKRPVPLLSLSGELERSQQRARRYQRHEHPGSQAAGRIDL